MKTRLAATGVIVLLCARLWWTIETEWPLGGPVAEVVVPPGSSTQTVAERLAAAGVIPQPSSFAYLVRWRGDGSKLKAGRYKFEGPYSLSDVEIKIANGDVERREVTFPEGRSIFDMAEIVKKVDLDEEKFLAAARDASPISDLDPQAKNLEGYLFPETYDVPDGIDESKLVGEMVKNTRRVLDELRLGPEGREIRGTKLDLRQIVTLASIVELETAAPSERPRIAGVFLNRLKTGMILQTDPTVIYAMKLEGRYAGNIRKSDLASDSPYNTYRFAGLPPGPIASPGRSALLAVLDPEETDAIYFVSRNDGTHVFSKSLRDHERAVDEFQRRRGARPQVSPSPAASPRR
jgi:UPF0755 protein